MGLHPERCNVIQRTDIVGADLVSARGDTMVTVWDDAHVGWTSGRHGDRPLRRFIIMTLKASPLDNRGV